MVTHAIYKNDLFVELAGWTSGSAEWSYDLTSPTDTGSARVSGPLACKDQTGERWGGMRGNAVVNLLADTDYTLRVYWGTGCAALNQLGSADFTTKASTWTAPSLAASSITNVTAVVTLSNWTDDWWYEVWKARAPISCTQAPSRSNSVTLGGLDYDTTYDVVAYSEAGCSKATGAIEFWEMVVFTTTGHLSITISNTTATGFTVTLSGHTDDDTFPRTWALNAVRKKTNGYWEYSTCYIKDKSDTTVTVSGLTVGQTYTIKVYRKNDCRRHSDTASFSTTTTSLTSQLGQGAATLSLNEHDGAWSYRGQLASGSSASASSAGPPGGGPARLWAASIDQCRAMPAGTYTAELLDLAADTSYSFTAWNDLSCLGDELGATSLATPEQWNLPPAAPAGLAATAGNGSVTLAWSDPSDSGITGYEHGLNHNDTSTGRFSGWGPWTAIGGSGAGTVGHVFTGLANGREYRFRLRAVNARGAGDAAPEAHPWFVSATPAGPVARPVVPGGLAAAPGDRSVTLSWSDPSDPTITGYEYRLNHNDTSTRRFSGWGPWTALYDVGVDVTGHVFKGLTNGREYRFRLRAVNAAGESGAAPDAPPWYVAAKPAAVSAMSLIEGPDGRLSNLSTMPANRRGGAVAVPLLPSTSDPHGRQGLLRVVNRSDRAGTVRISAFDDAGLGREPVALSMDAGAAVTLGSGDLERGAPEKGLARGAGPAPVGHWRLRLESELDILALAYVRQADGLLTAMHDMAPVSGGVHRVAAFGVESGGGHASLLRLANPGPAPARVAIVGIDDAGASPGSDVTVEVPPGASATLSARELEGGGAGFAGALGDGAGAWRLRVSSGQPLWVTSLTEGPSGRLSNLSTAPAGPCGSAATAPLFLSASDPHRRQSLLRVVNRSGRPGAVRIEASDDSRWPRAPLTLRVGAGAAVTLSSDDLEFGAPAKGLARGTGPAAAGHWRLRVASDLDIRTLSYVRHSDGLVTAMHDTAPVRAGVHRLAVFEEMAGHGQVGLLRLVNGGRQTAEIVLGGIEAGGEPSPRSVATPVPPARSVTLPLWTALPGRDR